MIVKSYSQRYELFTHSACEEQRDPVGDPPQRRTLVKPTYAQTLQSAFSWQDLYTSWLQTEPLSHCSPSSILPSPHVSGILEDTADAREAVLSVDPIESCEFVDSVERSEEKASDESSDELAEERSDESNEDASEESVEEFSEEDSEEFEELSEEELDDSEELEELSVELDEVHSQS